MKRIFVLSLVFLLLAGCKVKNYTPEITSVFELNATVISGDFSYDCKICKNERTVEVTVLSSAAEGMVMSYDGKRLNFVYNGFTYDINADNFERNNAAIVIYEVFEYIESVQQINIKKLESGYKYEGATSYGDFILLQNDDNTYDKITFKNSELLINFKQGD